MLRHARANRCEVLGGGYGIHDYEELSRYRPLMATVYPPRTCGNMMNSHGDGIGPTGTSISAGSWREKACRNATASSLGVHARRAKAPKLSAYLTKSGLARSLAISRLPNCSCWMRRTLPKAPSANTTATSGMPWRMAVAISLLV